MTSCSKCQKEFSDKGIGSHIWRVHTEEGQNFKPSFGKQIWNKGLTKFDHPSMIQRAETFRRRYKEGKYGVWKRSLSREIREKLSISMKKAHAEGRAWNIGRSRWNNEQSWPEKFFEMVIKNEFEDQNYETELPFGIYSFDFAWPDKKKAIEIDGKQHLEDPSQIERDIRKDKLVKERGWDLLRISWKDISNEPQFWINKAKQFISPSVA